MAVATNIGMRGPRKIRSAGLTAELYSDGKNYAVHATSRRGEQDGYMQSERSWTRTQLAYLWGRIS
jgi:hypothetical protein